jgi:DNA (cytosine-5)-methyltransferase 1
MTAYYNEIDPAAAQWLRNLITAGHIAPGYVDERSIEDVFPSDLRGFTQCHFFAGVGVWSHALRSAGWSDDRPVWTGSCPCQPFSAAGKGAGFDDERHLWPAFQHLIKECQPAIVFGEQVASKAVEPWIDLVHADLEAMGYAFGCVAFPSAGVGAPHIRDRLYWLADSKQHHCGREAAPSNHGQSQADRSSDWTGGCGGSLSGLADGHGMRFEPPAFPALRADAEHDAKPFGGAGWLADDNQERWGWRQGLSTGCVDDRAHAGRQQGDDGLVGIGEVGDVARPTGPTNGFWRAADWLLCRDGKWRPVEPGTFPLAHGAPARVGRLRAYGNAINAKAAQAFIESAMK